MISTEAYLANLEQLQREFEHLYRLDPAPDVTQFLVEPKEGHRETLLVYSPPEQVSSETSAGEQDEDELFLGLALDPKVLHSLSETHLEETNLEEFCLAVEGVSHFLCVIHRAREGREVSALELELQAEVDKFVAALVFVRRCQSLAPKRLIEKLYQEFTLHTNLSEGEVHRYQYANVLAYRYVHRLAESFLHQHRRSAMIQELRTFYRMCFWTKRRFIQER